MARDIPSAGGESRLLRQGSMVPVNCSRGAFPTHSVVYERGEDDRAGRDISVVWEILPCEVTAVCDIVDYQSGIYQLRADARYHGAAT